MKRHDTRAAWRRNGTLVGVAALLVMSVGCGSSKSGRQQDDFFTSGSREADQRAAQRMAKDQQITGTSDEAKGKTGSNSKSEQSQGAATLYERLGGEQGIAAIIDDFTTRALADPRVNWERKGVTQGGFLRRDESVTWKPTPTNLTNLKKHLAQFLALATGGPSKYDGREMKSVHADMRITNPEFDAAVGDLKASLDKLRIADKEQKELLAIIESTRPQIVTVR